MVFTRRELVDLLAAWVALGVAFTAFLFTPQVFLSEVLVFALSVSMATVGVGFLLHELAHKVVAVRYGQVAHFQADYGMLFVAIMAGLAGFLFAAPGAVVHRGRITPREHGLIALAGPVTNLLLAALFVPLVFVPAVGPIAHLGVTINAFLAAFNMIPFGPLDGKTVLNWSKAVFAVAFLVSAGSVATLYYTVGFGIFGL
ncbi:metalloprotease [Halobacteriales archaeon QS_8_69_26]|nr:MAG: metalloprotease [Halobacteriales archaeon QS_8_69_26]